MAWLWQFRLARAAKTTSVLLDSCRKQQYVQQHVIEVGDTPGHEVRVYELRRSFPGNAPVINGVKVKEMIGSGMSDYVERHWAEQQLHGVCARKW